MWFTLSRIFKWSEVSMVKMGFYIVVVVSCVVLSGCKVPYNHESQKHAKCQTEHPDNVYDCLSKRRY